MYVHREGRCRLGGACMGGLKRGWGINDSFFASCCGEVLSVLDLETILFFHFYCHPSPHAREGYLKHSDNVEKEFTFRNGGVIGSRRHARCLVFHGGEQSRMTAW